MTLEPLTIGMMVLICGIVWGGFVTLAVRAVRREREKRNEP